MKVLFKRTRPNIKYIRLLPLTVNREHWILLLIWGLFGLLHSLLAARKVKGYFTSLLGRYGGYYRPLYSILAFLNLGLVIAVQFSMKSFYLFSFPLVKWLAGLTIGVPGSVLMIVCMRKYFFRLSGIQALLGRDEGPKLESGGVHAYVRHPLYLGTLSTLWSIFLFFPLLSNLLACLAITLYTLIGIGLEEKKLSEDFGEEYMSYRRNTPMLIPNLPFR
jgi:protein-S-isoprenylcysteine O-methyltransferase Ste14